MTLKAVFFDLDGTLIDSAPDFHLALNKQLKRYDKAPMSPELIRPWVSHGSPSMMKIAFDLTEDDAIYTERRQEFLNIYEASLGEATTLFEGVKEVIDFIDSHHDLVWGIVTNKPFYLAQPLIHKIPEFKNCAYLLGGDSLAERKPHPMPLLHIADKCQVSPEQSIYVGDALRDIQSAKSAQMSSVVATYGYFTEAEDPLSWGAEYVINQPIELLNVLDSKMRIN